MFDSDTVMCVLYYYRLNHVDLLSIEGRPTCADPGGAGPRARGPLKVSPVPPKPHKSDMVETVGPTRSLARPLLSSRPLECKALISSIVESSDSRVSQH